MNTKSLILILALASGPASMAFPHGSYYNGEFHPDPPPPGPSGPPPPLPGPGSSNPGPSVPPPVPTGGGTGPASTPTGGGHHPVPVPASTPPGPAAPKGPATGGAPLQGPNTGTPAKTGAGPATGALSFDGPDTTSWEYWWLYNKDGYLELKSHVLAGEVSTGGDAALGLGTAAVSSSSAMMLDTRIVPGLLQVLDKETDNELVTSAMIALARLADGPRAAHASEWAHVFQRFVHDPNQEIAETSVLSRGLVGDESSAPDLVALLENSADAQKQVGGREVSARTRAFAAYALGMLASHSKNEDVRRFLVHHVVNELARPGHATPDIQVACIIALGLAPLRWADADGASAGATGTRGATTNASTKKGTVVATTSRETQIDAVLAILRDKEVHRLVRAHAPEALARLLVDAPQAAREEVVHALLEFVEPSARDKDEVVQGCVLALGAIADSDREKLDVQVRTTLMRLVEGGDLQSRCFAIISLGLAGARAGGEGSAEGVADVRKFLVSRLTEGKSRERAWAAIGLGILERGAAARGLEPSLSARGVMLSAFKDTGSGDEVAALAIGIGLAGDRKAVPALLAKLERTADAGTQGYLAVALGMLGDERAVEPLHRQLADARFKPKLLNDTAIGLALLDDSTLVPDLVKTLASAQSLASQSAAASVLGWIGDHRSIEPLCGLFEKREVTTSARAFAAVALGRVCDRDRLPWNAAVSTGIQYRAATDTLTSANGSGLLDIL
jgi:HEAT repeat protein